MTKKKPKPEKIDGLGPDDLKKLRAAIRQVWMWSHARRLCLKRALTEDGFARCEGCAQVVPKVYPDHIIPAGRLDAGFIKRMFVSSSGLQALCAKCHRKKTKEERAV